MRRKNPESIEPSEDWVLYQDGMEIKRGTNFELFKWMLNHHPQSVYYQLKYEGKALYSPSGKRSCYGK